MRKKYFRDLRQKKTAKAESCPVSPLNGFKRNNKKII